MSTTFKSILTGFTAGIAGCILVFQYYIKPQLGNLQPEEASATRFVNSTTESTPQLNFAPNQTGTASTIAVDFSEAARKATPSVVFINSISRGVTYSYWDWFFGDGGGTNSRTQVSSGSGVIFTRDGYIVTNNHVIESAERIEVNYNKRIYPAEVVGTDPSTDLAVIKINADNLVPATIVSSKDVQVGEWVIAVGNPYSLSSTVTAGIVSAKGRRIGILEDKFPLESFIQTDAAINPGNSGGALVNKNGELVGINSAILSRTGSYTGYAFAIPSDIVNKVFTDLVKFGVSQKSFIGGNVVDFDEVNATKYNLENRTEYRGVLLEKVTDNGPADKAGLRPGDIIIQLNSRPVNSQSEFEETLGYLNPGEKISLLYLRDGKQESASLTLVNINGGTEVVRRKIITSSELGAQLEANQYGVKVFKIQEKGKLGKLEIPENFTIMEINRIRVKDPQDVIEFFNKFKGRGYLIGVSSSKQKLQIQFIL